MNSIFHQTDLGWWLRNLLDIGLVSFLIYRVLVLIKGTRAVPMLGGLTIMVALYFLSRPLGLTTVNWILWSFLSSIIVVVVVLFQDEIRRGLTKVGMQPFFKRSESSSFTKVVEDIAIICVKLARDKLGALIVVQREVGLDDFVEDAVVLDALVNRKLLQTIFLKESPLHDGAVLIEGDRIKAAGCLLPLSYSPDIDPSLGTRHRAALGLSQRSDAIVIIVSEETGSISVAVDGKIHRNVDGGPLRDMLERLLLQKYAFEMLEDESE